MTVSNAFSSGNMLAGTSAERGKIINLFDINIGEIQCDTNIEFKEK